MTCGVIPVWMNMRLNKSLRTEMRHFMSLGTGKFEDRPWTLLLCKMGVELWEIGSRPPAST